MNAVNGVVLLDKPEGVTSFGALRDIKRRFNTRRVGHTGTLDPMATGLMVVLVGQATRCARFFNGLDKTYQAAITFGAETDSHDRTGEIVRQASVPEASTVLDLLGEFLGTIRQVPPAYSAVHVDGARAHELARKGEKPELKEREVCIRALEGTFADDCTLKLTLTCSAGTYVRSLARDLGRAAGSAAHLSFLRRTAVGPFFLDQQRGVGSSNEPPVMTTREALLRLDSFVEWLVPSHTARTMQNGGRVLMEPGIAAPGQHILATHDAIPVAVGRSRLGQFVYDMVFPRQEAGDA